MSALYGEVIAEHFRRPRNQGRLESPDASYLFSSSCMWLPTWIAQTLLSLVFR